MVGVEQLRALVILLLDSGDLTPQGARLIRAALLEVES